MPRGAPTVSVLMCCYNAARWLRDALASVRLQTFEDYELIVVDDGSTDETSAILAHWSAADDRVVVISKSNTGLTDSLNVGLERARGAWIARLDADDVCEPHRLATQLAYLTAHPRVTLLGSGFVEIDQAGRAGRRYRPPPGGWRLGHLEGMQRFFPHSSAMFRRDLAQRLGGYNSRFSKSQDWDLWLRFAEASQLGSLAAPLVRIRKHPGQISHSTTGVSQQTYGIVGSVCHFLRIHGAPDPSTERDPSSWNRLVPWVEDQLRDEGYRAQRSAWGRMSAEMAGSGSIVSRGFRGGATLLRSGHARTLLLEKAFGSSLPRQLALKWRTHACAASSA